MSFAIIGDYAVSIDIFMYRLHIDILVRYFSRASFV